MAALVAVLRESPGNHQTNKRNDISMSSGVHLIRKTAEWRPNRHLRTGFAGSGRAGEGMTLQVAGPREIILLLMCGVQL
jgi:hypothetical protein